MKKGPAKIVVKTALFLMPLLLFLIFYIILDPFRVIHHYENYQENCFVALNRDFVSTQVYLKNYKQQHYNAFIFGNSRSLSFLCHDWEKHIHAKAFHYDASGESIKALRDKVIFINNKGEKIDHALLIFDDFLLSLTDPLTGPVSEPHPAVSGGGWLNFHAVYFKAFLSEFYFVKFLDYKTNRTFRPYMKGVVETRPITYDPISNDFYLEIYDKEIEKDPQGYARKHPEAYPPRDTVNYHETRKVIGRKQKMLLYDIAAVFKNQKTNFKIIFSPTYDQVHFNKTDLAVIQEIFGKENVFDFSGKNEFTRDWKNFYESFHYRPKVARAILDSIYSKQ